MAKKKASPRSTVKMPDRDDSAERFQRNTMKSSFVLGLSQAMMEFLCAVSEDTHWDRGRYSNLHAPDSWLSTSHALERRGLIRRKTQEQIDKMRESDFQDSRCFWELTKVGLAVVDLLKASGIFVEAEEASERKARA